MIESKYKNIDRRLSVAPMMEYTDKHCRYLLRLISRRILLYTEMVTSGAVMNGDRKFLLDFDPFEHPLALQLGGSNPKELSTAAKIAEHWGYDEVNLNVGCPSNKVQNGAIGACLMAHPQIVADCLAAIQNCVTIPVTVKCRIGIDDQDSDEALKEFVKTIADAGCRTFIVHARKAILKGLSPKQNRDIPPLNYDRVYRLKQEFPGLEIIINGGITSLEQSLLHLQQVDGVMIGREAYHNPYVLAEADQKIFGHLSPSLTRHQILEQFIAYSQDEVAKGTALKHMAKHTFGLFHGQPGARQYRRFLSEHIHKDTAETRILQQALSFVSAS
ncbi:MAG: tRNA dihydrouridine(20/20a) synthase DusA [Pseudomonadales bacterium]|nr:tRNA dihydrouridine(20/20a) synthase DusA [Pseudomonadales bacterium]